MIDEKTAMQWAKDAGFEFWTGEYDYYQCTAEQIQMLIGRAMNEAYERAAALAENGEDRLMGEWQAARIRALKRKQQK